MSDQSDPKIISCLAHVCFTVSDLQASVDFYCGQLGMTKAFEFRRPDGTWHGQYIHAGGRNFIELFVGTLGEPAEGQSYRHICLEVEDIERTVSVLRERGVEVGGLGSGGACGPGWRIPMATASSCTSPRLTPSRPRI